MSHTSGSTSSPIPISPFSPSPFSANSDSHYTSDDQPDLGAFRTVLREWVYLQPPPRIPVWAPGSVMSTQTGTERDTVTAMDSDVETEQRSTVWNQRPIADYLQVSGASISASGISRDRARGSDLDGESSKDSDMDTDTDTEGARTVEIETEIGYGSYTPSPLRTQRSLDDDSVQSLRVDGDSDNDASTSMVSTLSSLPLQLRRLSLTLDSLASRTESDFSPSAKSQALSSSTPQTSSTRDSRPLSLRNESQLSFGIEPPLSFALESPSSYITHSQSSFDTRSQASFHTASEIYSRDMPSPRADIHVPSLGYLDEALNFIAAERARWNAQREASDWKHVIESPTAATRKWQRRQVMQGPHEYNSLSIASNANISIAANNTIFNMINGVQPTQSHNYILIEDYHEHDEKEDKDMRHQDKGRSISTPATPRLSKPDTIIRVSTPFSNLNTDILATHHPVHALQHPEETTHPSLSMDTATSTDTPTPSPPRKYRPKTRSQTKTKARTKSQRPQIRIITATPVLTHSKSTPALRGSRKVLEGNRNLGGIGEAVMDPHYTRSKHRSHSRLLTGHGTSGIGDDPGAVTSEAYEENGSDSERMRLVQLAKGLEVLFPEEGETLKDVEKRLVVANPDSREDSNVATTAHVRRGRRDRGVGKEKKEAQEGEDFLDPRGREVREGDPLVHVFIDHSNILIGLLTYLRRHSLQKSPHKSPMGLSDQIPALVTKDKSIDERRGEMKAGIKPKPPKPKPPNPPEEQAENVETAQGGDRGIRTRLRASGAISGDRGTRADTGRRPEWHTTSQEKMKLSTSSSSNLNNPDTNSTYTTPIPLPSFATANRSGNLGPNIPGVTPAGHRSSTSPSTVTTSSAYLTTSNTDSIISSANVSQTISYRSKQELIYSRRIMSNSKSTHTTIPTSIINVLSSANSQDEERRERDSSDEPQQKKKKSARYLLSHTALALILERGRPITRRALVTSSPLYQPMDTMQKLGYEVGVYLRVPDLGDGMDRERHRHKRRRSEDGSGAGKVASISDISPKKKSKDHIRHTSEGNVMEIMGMSVGEEAGKGVAKSLPSPSFLSSHSAPSSSKSPSHQHIQRYHQTLRHPHRAVGPDVGTSAPLRIRYREQGVDELLQLKLHQALAATDHVPEGATIVLATGDGNVGQFNEDGFLGPVRTALKRGWKVELYAWEGGLGRVWRREFEESEWGQSGMFRIIGMEQFAWSLVE